MFNEFIEEFLLDAEELVTEISSCLLLLESGESLELHYRNLFSSLHTLKGSSAMVGFLNVEKIVHDMENKVKSFEGTHELEDFVLNRLFEQLILVEKILEHGADGVNVEVEDHKPEPVQIEKCTKQFKVPKNDQVKEVNETPNSKPVYGLPNILVVDDELGVHQLIKKMLSNKFNVFFAENPIEANDLLEKHDFHVIASDIKMPEEDGITFLCRIKKMNKDIPVILFTGHANKEIVIDSVNNGAFHFLEKPFKKQEINEAICKAMKRRAENYIANANKIILAEKA